MRVLKPRTVPRSSGRKSKNKVRSVSVASEIIFPFGCFLEDELQIRRLTAQPGAVIDDLAVDLACCEVDETQKVSSETPAKKTLANHSLNAPASRYKST